MFLLSQLSRDEQSRNEISRSFSGFMLPRVFLSAKVRWDLVGD